MSTIVLSRTRLREAREAAGMSQVDAAEAVGVARATLQNAEAGRFTPRADALARLAALYGVTLDSLFVHETQPATPSAERVIRQTNDKTPLAVSGKSSASGA